MFKWQMDFDNKQLQSMGRSDALKGSVVLTYDIVLIHIEDPHWGSTLAKNYSTPYHHMAIFTDLCINGHIITLGNINKCKIHVLEGW